MPPRTSPSARSQPRRTRSGSPRRAAHRRREVGRDAEPRRGACRRGARRHGGAPRRHRRGARRAGSGGRPSSPGRRLRGAGRGGAPQEARRVRRVCSCSAPSRAASSRSSSRRCAASSPIACSVLRPISTTTSPSSITLPSSSQGESRGASRLRRPGEQQDELRRGTRAGPTASCRARSRPRAKAPRVDLVSPDDRRPFRGAPFDRGRNDRPAGPGDRGERPPVDRPGFVPRARSSDRPRAAATCRRPTTASASGMAIARSR